MARDYMPLALASTIAETVVNAQAPNLHEYADLWGYNGVACASEGSVGYQFGGAGTAQFRKAQLQANGGWVTNPAGFSPPAFPDGGRNGAGMAVVGGKVYIIGGSKAGNPDYSQTLYRWDPSTNVWTSLASLPTIVNTCHAVVVGQKIYVKCEATSSTTSADGRIFVYDIASNTWSTLVTLPINTFRGQFWYWNGFLFYKAGQDSSGNRPSTLYKIDAITGAVSIAATAPAADAYGTNAVVIDGFAYYGGGVSNSSNLILSYDCRLNTWTFQLNPVLVGGTTWVAMRSSCHMLGLVDPSTGDTELFYGGHESSAQVGSTNGGDYSRYSVRWKPRTRAPYASNLRALRALAAS